MRFAVESGCEPHGKTGKNPSKYGGFLWGRNLSVTFLSALKKVNGTKTVLLVMSEKYKASRRGVVVYVRKVTTKIKGVEYENWEVADYPCNGQA